MMMAFLLSLIISLILLALIVLCANSSTPALFFRGALPCLLLSFMALVFYLMCIRLGCIELFWSIFSHLQGAIMDRALRFLLAQVGCAGGLASAFVFLSKAFLTAEATYMLPSSSGPGSSGPQSQPVLEGRPIPKAQEWEAIASGKYMASVVHIPGEIEDVSTLSKLGRLNGTLLFLKDYVWSGVIQPLYTRDIQDELDQTKEHLLPAKLDFVRRRELKRFGIPPEE